MLIEGILMVLLCPEFKMILPVACFTAVYPHAKCERVRFWFFEGNMFLS